MGNRGELGGQWQESKSLFLPLAFLLSGVLLRAVILLFQQITNFCQ